MGYDLTRFIGGIDEEFVCTLCKKVLKEPMQTTCEHMFCKLCLHMWLLQYECCPEDHKPLTMDQVKAPGRIIRNLLNKLIIKCDFQKLGCTKKVTMEHLEEHGNNCVYNPKFVIVREEADNTLILQDELMDPQPINLVVEKRSMPEDKPVVVEEKRIKIEETSARADEKTVRVEEKSAQVEDKGAQSIAYQQQKNELVHKTPHQQKPLPEPSDFDSDSVPMNWQILYQYAAKIGFLKVISQSVCAFAQSGTAVSPADPSFKVKIMEFYELKYVAIGLSSIGHRADRIPGLYGESIAMDSSGDLICGRVAAGMSSKWYAGDIIECGVKFPDNYADNKPCHLKIYFMKNGKLVAERKVPRPKNGLFPSIYSFEGAEGSWWNKGQINITTVNTGGSKFKFFK